MGAARHVGLPVHQAHHDRHRALPRRGPRPDGHAVCGPVPRGALLRHRAQACQPARRPAVREGLAGRVRLHKDGLQLRPHAVDAEGECRISETIFKFIPACGLLCC